MLQKKIGLQKILQTLLKKLQRTVLKKNLAKARYFCILSDGSIDSSVAEEELCMFCFFCVVSQH